MNLKLWSVDFFKDIAAKIVINEASARAFHELHEKVKVFTQNPVDIPLQGGGWSHNYNCPDDGSYLKSIDRHHHQCPVCQKIWTGSPWDDTAVANEHWNNSRNCRDAAILFGITREQKWAEWAMDVLLFYSKYYHQYPFHDKIGGQEKTGGKVQCQTLSESTWIVPLAQACHILQEYNVLTPNQQDFVKDNLFWPVVKIIQGNPMGKSNWQSHHNAAKATIAVVIKDRELFDEAIVDKENGFLFQMENSLGDDGFWYEGSWGYHFYALEAHVMTVLAALCFDIRLYENRRFKAMFTAPVNCQFPNHTLPSIHDSHEVNLMQYEYLYEISYAFWGFGREIINESARNSLFSLLYGIECVRPEKAKRPASFTAVYDLKKPGMVFAKIQDENYRFCHGILLDYGEHGGGHGHYDKLNLLYYAQGYNWMTDAGTVPYGNPLYKTWFRQTIAHNTMVVGGVSQQEATGKLLELKKLPEEIQVKAEVRGAYPGVIMQRDLILTSQVLIDVCYVSSKEPQNLDWVIHTPGYPVFEKGNALKFKSDHQIKLGSKDGYQFIRELNRAEEHGQQWMVEWKRADSKNDQHRFQIHGWELGVQSRIFLGESPATVDVKRRSTLIRCKETVKDACFITVFRTCANDDPNLELWPGVHDSINYRLKVVLGHHVHYTLTLPVQYHAE